MIARPKARCYCRAGCGRAAPKLAEVDPLRVRSAGCPVNATTRQPHGDGAGEPAVDYRDGLHLRDTVLWFDAPRSRELSFISHALVPDALAHRKMLSSDHTATLLEAIAAAHGHRRRHFPQPLATPYRRPFALGELSLELFPSGFMLGAASLQVEWRQRTIVYAGHISPWRSPLVEGVEARSCDTLVLPCPLARIASRKLLQQKKCERQILGFVEQALADDRHAVLLCPPAGVAQQLIHLLSGADPGRPIWAHRVIYAAAQAYTRLTSLDAAALRRFNPGERRPAGIVLWPVKLHRSTALATIGRRRSAYVSSLTLLEGAARDIDCDATLPFGEHADRQTLLDYVRRCRPHHVVLVGCDSDPLAAAIRRAGPTVSRAGPSEQLSLL